jgi:cation diffusion facilitator CzcD-associated flavoprotein CzcO
MQSQEKKTTVTVIGAGAGGFGLITHLGCAGHRCKGGVILYTVGLLKFSSVGGPPCSALCLNALSKRVRSR